MGRLGIWEIIFIVLVIVILFGAKRLPEIGSAVGKAIREFKKASKEVENSIHEAAEDKNDGQKK